MQNSLFGDSPAASLPTSAKPLKKSAQTVEPAHQAPTLIELAQSLPTHLRLGTSSWNYPGWDKLVWDGDYSDSVLSRYGLTAYAKHPLLRTVSIDRSFYRPLNVAQFAEYASQVGQDFRFVVKAPSLITDALVRDESGRGMRPNAHFLNAAEAVQMFVEPALEGLGHKLGALVFQISPLPGHWLAQMPRLIDQLHQLLAALPDLKPIAPDGVIAVEVRDPHWLTPQFVAALRATGATYCMGLHAKMPPIAEQLPILRALWPGPLVCRWNLNPIHGAYGYEDARDLYSPYDKLVDPDLETRAALVRVIAGTAGAGQNVYVTLSNKAEGCAPLSIIELARAIHQPP
ncbi:DUF72 domain-containing protein [Cellvibrio japonicus]|uniref:DUF72 domain-containing protein n=1 Tax=Cellvibrio japonicus (strain Ueda107) TaxID=498211 RepID=B3PE86_CELJU|nr:DUF72 domain-containing protein [Cellvibrio japonicus]ACE85449.1 conserved hypothetical protein [Cellvibrio japonicus Ueda107]QEI12126.1 DUF72 domain-containing protein [Cellvibrio japonicus]QEI15700.1 DUF72 domain-containing protein [Cellvibrio japonicus]QEI19278.1 DUF72 domain-containing protein [Cellvibrio japonicus]